jgi:formylglycine-generating enzyme
LSAFGLNGRIFVRKENERWNAKTAAIFHVQREVGMKRVAAIGLLLACGARTQLDGAVAADGVGGGDSSSNVADVSIPITSLPPSCQGVGPGLSDCGVDHDSCCTSLDVAGGTFYRTYENYASGLINEGDPATVSSFRLDKYLVTVARFRKFVEASNSGWSPATGSGKHAHLNQGSGLVNVAVDSGIAYEPGWNVADVSQIAPTDAHLIVDKYSTWTTLPAAQEAKPINEVNWYEAYAFCIWDGGFLPSEAEWEYAAAAGSEQRSYPWGATYPGNDPHVASQYAIYDCEYAPNPNGGGCAGPNTGVAEIAPVGVTNRGRAKWGQFDLAGDMSEWTLDAYATYTPCADCAYVPGQASERSRRGGDYVNQLDLIRPWSRTKGGAVGRSSVFGFRCARAP